MQFLLFYFSLALGAAVVSYLAALFSARLARKAGAVDQPTGGRKIHTRPIPLYGGVGISLTLLVILGLLSTPGYLSSFGLRSAQILGLTAGIIILLIGGVIDDRRPLSPAVQILFSVSASLAVLFSGTGIMQVTNPGGGAFSLVWWKYDPLNLSLPADLLTLAWLLLTIYATKLLDGLDGLVTGLAVIGSGLIGALTLSPAYYQPGVALLTAAAGGSFLGFLPRNVHPAKQFLGEAGSTLAGFVLGFLAIVSSAKIAVALSVLAIPLADACLVVLGRLRRGVSPWKGDDTHLHFRLLRAGVSHRGAVVLLWGVSLAAGMAALTMQTRGKIFLVAVLIVLTVLISWMAKHYAKKARVAAQ